MRLRWLLCTAAIAWLLIGLLLSGGRVVGAEPASLAEPESRSAVRADQKVAGPGEAAVLFARVVPATAIEVSAPAPVAERVPVPSPLELYEAEQGTELDQLFANLRDDRIRGNANMALSRLSSISRQGPSQRAAVRVRAERALSSYDRQEADLCAELLMRLALHAWSDIDRAAPHPRVLDLAAKTLAGAPVASYGIPHRPVSRHSLELAIAYPDAMESRVLPLLHHWDSDTRTDAATALGLAGREQHAERIVAALLPNLQDNDRRNDALSTSFTLRKLGLSVLPHLPTPAAAPDEQSAWFLQAIRMELEEPGSSRALGARGNLSPYTLTVWQPRFRVLRADPDGV